MSESSEFQLLDRQSADLDTRVQDAILRDSTTLVDSFERQYRLILQKAQKIQAIQRDTSELFDELDEDGPLYLYKGSLTFLKFLADSITRFRVLISSIQIIDAKAKKIPQTFYTPSIAVEPSVRTSTEALKSQRKKTSGDKGDPKKVFVVHGRNKKANEAMFTFLRAIGLEPIEWLEAIKLTEKATPYIGEVLDAAFSHARTIVVLVTGDDLARLGTRFTDKGDVDEELTPQARANVIFESGLAFGWAEERTILVELGRCRPFSDLAGKYVVKIDNSPEKRQILVSRLKAAGCDVQTEDRTDWLNAGDFDSAMVVHPDKK